MIKIILNKQLEEEVYLDFFDYKIGGIDFGGLILKDHPDLNKNNYKEYIDTFYVKNEKELEKQLFELNKSLDNTQNIFFDVLRSIFKKDYSEREYNGALSIFDCNPRYLDKKFFQIYYKRGPLNKRKVAYHEVLHFIFFDYCDEYLPHLTAGLDKNSGSYWALSEIFNVIILNKPELQIFLKDPEGMFYPELKDDCVSIEKIWRRVDENIENFIEASLEFLKKYD